MCRVASPRGLFLSLLTVLALPALALAQTPQVRISQIFNYGGLVANQPRANYIELYNAGATTVNLTGWTVQVSSASTGGFWQKLPLIGVIGPRSYYLIQTSPDGSVGTPLPGADVGPFNLVMSQSGGKVALVVDSITISGRPACPFDADVIDFVGYGDADQRTPCSASTPTFNNAPLPALPSALLRRCDGKADIGTNFDTFSTGPASPRSRQSPPNMNVDIAVVPAPASIPTYPGQIVTIATTASASACAGVITGVSINLGPLGGPTSVPLTLASGQYRTTVNLASYALNPGAYQLDLTATASRISEVGSGKVTLLIRPPNDDCANATVLSAESLPTQYTVNNDGAQPDVDPGACTASPQGDFGVWYAFVPPSSGVLRVEQTSQQDAAIAIFQNSCGPTGNLVCANDNTAAAPVTAGQTYKILVVRRNPTQTTAPALRLNFSFTTVAPNDSPCTAIPLQVGTPVTGSNADATSTGDGPSVSCSGGTITPVKSVWYAFTPPATGLFRLSTCGSPIDTDLSIFTVTGCGGASTPVYTPIAACDRVACIGGEPGPGPGTGSPDAAQIDSVTLTAGVMYSIRVSSAGTPAGGAFRLLLTSIVTGACCDTATGACSLSTTGACPTGITFLGAGTTCAPGACIATPSGGCCDFAIAACSVTTAGACPAPRVYLGDGSSCAPGACSISNDDCEHAVRVFVNSPVSGSTVTATTTVALSLDLCGPANTVDGSDVFFIFTPPVSTLYDISLCGADFDSILSIHSACPPTVANRLLCSDDAVPACAGATHARASRIPAAVLNAAHTYIIRVAGFGGATGNFTLSIDSTGVCCRGATCSTTLYTPQACAAAGAPGVTPGFIGAATSCNAPGTHTFPCCHADFNHNGAVEAQDIFDFLAAWFNSSPFTHVGGDGVTPPTQQDIFDFLALWFTGGCA